MRKTRTSPSLEPRPRRLITEVPLHVLPPAMRKKTMAAYEAAMRHPDYRMTYREAAHLYKVSYSSLRYYVHMGELSVVGKGPSTRISHQALRALIASPRRTGRPSETFETIKQHR